MVVFRIIVRIDLLHLTRSFTEVCQSKILFRRFPLFYDLFFDNSLTQTMSRATFASF